MGHPWRSARPEFNGVAEHRVPIQRVTAADVLRWGQARESWLQLGGSPAHTDPARVYGVKRTSALFELEYWKVRHYTLLIKLHICFTFDQTVVSVPAVGYNPLPA